MRSADRSEDRNQHEQHRAGGRSVGEQRDAHVAGSQALAHDSRSDDSGQQQRRAERLGGQSFWRA